MNIFGLCLVRDEADVLPYTLEAARAWARRIYVTDNGSTDGTWEFLQTYARRYPEVVLCGRDPGPFRSEIRGEMANAFLDEARSGDWWCRLDADEFYVDDPRAFLPHVAARAHVVWSLSIQYYFTDEDLRSYEENPTAWTTGWRPGRSRFYRANWSEPRFVRHVPGRRWPRDWPDNFRWLRSAGERIRLKHYQYRSPPQMEQRLRLRQSAVHGFRHEKGDGWLVGSLGRNDLVHPDWTGPDELWRARVVRASALHCDAGAGDPIIDAAELPALPGSLPRRLLNRMRRILRR